MSIAALLGVVKGAASYWREIALGLLALGLLWYRGQYHECQADRAAAIVEAQSRADKLSADLADEQAKKATVIEKKVVEYVDRIKRVPGDPNCPADERERLGSRGVRDILGNPKAK